MTISFPDWDRVTEYDIQQQIKRLEIKLHGKHIGADRRSDIVLLIKCWKERLVK